MKPLLNHRAFDLDELEVFGLIASHCLLLRCLLLRARRRRFTRLTTIFVGGFLGRFFGAPLLLLLLLPLRHNLIDTVVGLHEAVAAADVVEIVGLGI